MGIVTETGCTRDWLRDPPEHFFPIYAISEETYLEMIAWCEENIGEKGYHWRPLFVSYFWFDRVNDRVAFSIRFREPTP